MSASVQHSFNSTAPGSCRNFDLRPRRKVNVQCSTMLPSFLAVRHMWRVHCRKAGNSQLVLCFSIGNIDFECSKFSKNLHYALCCLYSCSLPDWIAPAAWLRPWRCAAAPTLRPAALVSSKGDATIEEMSHSGQADAIWLQACYNRTYIYIYK